MARQLKYFAGAEVMPGCVATCTGLTETDILTQVITHARHGRVGRKPRGNDVDSLCCQSMSTS